MWSSHFPETYLICTLVNDTQPRWDSARSAGAGNDRNERYPTFPTIALPAGGEAEAGNFCRIWAFATLHGGD